jgi:hypothetical protein
MLDQGDADDQYQPEAEVEDIENPIQEPEA